MLTMIDRAAFHKLSCGLYIIGSKAGGRFAGCVVNTVLQVTSKPFQLSVTLNKENATTKAVQESGRFTASVVDEAMGMETIGCFGFHTSAELDKFGEVAHAFDACGVPYLEQDCSAWFSCRVVDSIDVGTHVVFIGEVEENGVLAGPHPMTYSFYHLVKGGKTPPRASSYTGEGSSSDVAADNAAGAKAAEGAGLKHAWRCTICGHIEYVDELPENFSCPVCGVGPEHFERIEL